jgi:hypothetical protein
VDAFTQLSVSEAAALKPNLDVTTFGGEFELVRHGKGGPVCIHETADRL